MKSLIDESEDPAQQLDQLRLRAAELESALQEERTRRQEREVWFQQKQQEYLEILEGSTAGTLVGIGDINRLEAASQETAAALAANERQYWDLVKYAPSAIYEVDFLTRRFLSVNDAMCQVTGYSRDELLSMNPLDLLDQPSQEVFQARINQWLSGRKPPSGVDYLIRTKDGREIWTNLQVTFTVEENGHPRGATVVAHDVTARKRAEMTVHENEKRLTFLVKLNDALRPLSGPVEAQLAACRVLAEHLQADQVLYGDVTDEKQIVIQYGVVDGKDVVIDFTHMGGLDENVARSYRAGNWQIINDVQSDPNLGAEHKRGLASAGVAAHLSRGLIKDGRWIAALGVNSSSPRIWTQAELELVDETIQRIWAAVARVRAEEEVRQARDQLEVMVAERTEELHHLNQRLVQTIESISDAFFTVDRQWKITYWNQAAEKMFGPKFLDVADRSMWEVFPRLVGTDACRQYQLAMSSDLPVSFVMRGIYVDFWAEINAYPSANGLTIYIKDINERRKAEQALQQSEERFRKIFNNSQDMIAIIDNQDNTYVDVNPSFLDTMGYSRREVIGKTTAELTIGTPNNPLDTETVLQRLNMQGGSELHEHYLRTKSGKLITVLASLIWMDIDGRTCRVAVIKDITELKRYEREVARLDRLNLIGEMAAGIGHEIRNPMTAVRGFLQMLGDKPEYADDLAFFELMIEELDRANGIISEFLSLARDKMIDLQPGSLDSVINILHPMIVSDANLREIDVKLDLNGVSAVLIDKSEIRQLILNMSRNAMEAMSSHGILTIGTRQEGEAVVLYIRDEGGGLAPEIIDRLGTPFVTTKENGTGLGLAMCYSIAARHKARIDFETGPEGTTFYVRFPIAVRLTADQMEINGPGGGHLTIPSPRPKTRHTLG